MSAEVTELLSIAIKAGLSAVAVAQFARIIQNYKNYRVRVKKDNQLGYSTDFLVQGSVGSLPPVNVPSKEDVHTHVLCVD